MAVSSAVEFDAGVAPHRPALLAYAYRMLASWSDAEDAVQDTLVRAWKGLGGLEDAAALRGWLFRVCTRVCLDVIAARKRRHLPDELHPAAQPGDDPLPDLLHDFVEPAPVARLDLSVGPEATVGQRESVALAFLLALQALPGTQRAALLLKDVLGFSAQDTAAHLETTVPAVNSLLQRARASLDERSPKRARRASAPHERELLGRYLRVWEASDVAGLVSLLREDATLTMPPLALWFKGAPAIVGFYGQAVFAPLVDAQRFRAEAVEAAGHPALVISSRQGPGAPRTPSVLQVLELDGDRIARIVAWVDPALAARFLSAAD